VKLIDADALIKDINSRMFTSDVATTLAVGMATAWLENAPTVEAKSQWIPVEKKLPNDNEKVIAMGSGGGIYIAIYNHPDWWGEWYKINDRHHYCDPVAWCHLPEPYEGVTKNEG